MNDLDYFIMMNQHFTVDEKLMAVDYFFFVTVKSTEDIPI